MGGAPAVQTVRHDVGWNEAQTQQIQDALFRSKRVAQAIPVTQPAFQFSVPSFAYKLRGNWTAPDVPTAPISYPYPVEAPTIQYRNKSWDYLIAQAANPVQPVVYRSMQLSAPSITVSISS
jgi:hypothetical protein